MDSAVDARFLCVTEVCQSFNEPSGLQSLQRRRECQEKPHVPHRTQSRHVPTGTTVNVQGIRMLSANQRESAALVALDG